MVLRIFRHFVPVSIILLAISDLLLVAMTVFLLEKPLAPSYFTDVLHSPSLILSALIATGMIMSGLYHGKAFLDFRSMAIQIGFSFGFCWVIGVVFGIYFDSKLGIPNLFWDVQKVIFTWLVCILITRAVFITLIDTNAFKRRVLVYGTGKKAARITATPFGGNHRYYTPVIYREERKHSNGVPDQVDRDFDREKPNSILEQAIANRVSEIVIATDDRRGLPVNELLQCRISGIKVTDYLDFIERQTKTVDLGALSPGWLIFSDGFRASRQARLLKRCFDIMLSLGLLLLTLPVLLLTCVLIKLDSRGPILYRQERTGLGGRPFILLKFRSMCTDAEKDGPRWAATGDSRVTRVGAIIRKLRIDELPQLLNALRGDMSFVGPRPERPCFIEQLVEQIPFYAERHCVKPGITGWAQINYPYGASLEDARKKLSYDLYYVKNQGLFLDAVIALQTVRVILWADGSR